MRTNNSKFLGVVLLLAVSSMAGCGQQQENQLVESLLYVCIGNHACEPTCPFQQIQNLNNPNEPQSSSILCSAPDTFAATAVKTNAYWFVENGRVLYGRRGTTFQYQGIQKKMKWRRAAMGSDTDRWLITSDSYADSCWDGGYLEALDSAGAVLATIHFPCRSLTKDQPFVVPAGTDALLLASGDWGVSIQIVTAE